MVADCQSYQNADSRNGWKKFLADKCGIDLDNDDTGAITGSDAGGSTTKTASGIVPESGALNSSTDDSFTVNGLKVKLGYFYTDYDATSISYSSLSNDTQRYIWKALRSWWAPNSLNLITQSYGSNYGFNSNSSATVKEMYFGFMNENSGTLASTPYRYYTGSGKTTSLGMKVNMNFYNNIPVGNVDGQSSSTNAYLDRTLAHEFTHAVMAANVNHFAELPEFISEGMAELTHGIDDERTSTIESLAANPNSLKSSLSLIPGTGTNVAYAGGYMFLRYLAKQGSEHYPASSTSSSSLYSLQSKSVNAGEAGSSNEVSVKGAVLTVTKNFADDMLDLSNYSSSVKKVKTTSNSRDLMIVGNRNANSIVAGAGSDSIFANVGKDTINGGAGNDLIYGEAGNDSINGGKGNDSINGGTGNDTLTGGAGKNVFVFGAEFGKDVITDYTAGSDKIKLAVENASVTSSVVKGKNVVLTVGNIGTITVQNAKGKKITVVDHSGKSTSSVYGGLALTDSSSAKTTLSAKEKSADASSRKKAVKITGNKLDNAILGGSGNDSLYGGAGNDSLSGNAGNDKLYGQDGKDVLRGGSGNDTLTGGKGNDSLWGDAGKDTFIYGSGDGKDVIYGFENDDLLKITGKFSASYNSSKDEVYFKVGTTAKAITLSDFTATSFHVNSATYQINSKNKFVKK